MSRAPAAVKPFFRVLTPDEARRVLASFEPVGPTTCPTIESVGRVLATDLFAAESVPHFHRANMDGYAVRAKSTFGASASQPGYLKLTGTIEMGEEATTALEPGEAQRISTGGMLPPGADAVVMVEYCEELIDGTVEIGRAVSPWENVLRVGEDIAAGDPIFSAGRRLRSQDIGALTGVGLTEVDVFVEPNVALISTGDEIVAPDETPPPGKIRNVNLFSLAAMIRECGANPVDFGVLADRPEVLEATLARAVESTDVVLLSGGSSAGAKDLTLEVIASFESSEILFHGISIAPGKPTILGRIGHRPIVGLPGHPVSALVIFRLFGGPLLRILGGEPEATAFDLGRSVPATLGRNAPSQPGREDWIRVALETGSNGERLAHPIPGKSGAVFSLVRADGMVRIPLEAEGLEAGEPVDVVLF